MIKFNQNAWLKRYINMNTKLRKKTSNNRTDKNLSNIRTKSSYQKFKENLLAREMRKAQKFMNNL